MEYVCKRIMSSEHKNVPTYKRTSTQIQNQTLCFVFYSTFLCRVVFTQHVPHKKKPQKLSCKNMQGIRKLTVNSCGIVNTAFLLEKSTDSNSECYSKEIVHIPEDV